MTLPKQASTTLKTYLVEEGYNTPHSSNSNFTLGKALFYLGGAAIIIFGGRYIYTNFISDKESGKLADSLETQQATLINSILNNSFLSAIYLPQADADKLIALAKQIKNWDGVQTSYKNLFGDNLSELLSHKLSSANWQQFLNNLAVKGKPQNSGGTTIVTPAIPTASGLKVNDAVFLNWAGKSSINLYTNSTDYPQKPIILNKPASIASTAFGTIIRIDNIQYVGSSVSMALAQVQLSTGNKLWVRVVDLSKVRVLGSVGPIGNSINVLSLAV